MALPDYDVKDRNAWLRLDRPNVKNAINVETMRGLRTAVTNIEDDESVDRVVVTGAGDIFSAGGDIKEMIARRGKSAATFEVHVKGMADVIERITHSDKLYVARVNGDAIGAGFGLMLACDLSVAVDTARFSAAFGKVGLVGDSGVSPLLVRKVGLARALEVMLTARFVAAREAERWGLVNRIASPAQLDTVVETLLAEVSVLPSATAGRLKRQLRLNGTAPIPEALRAEALLQGLSFATPEHAERTDAFVKKRKR